MDQETFYLIGAIFGGLFIGGFCGGAPFIIGLIKKRILLAIISMVSCITFGIVCSTLLYIPAFTSAFLSVIFVLIILFVKKNEKQKK